MAHDQKPIIQIDDLAPLTTLGGYHASWQEGTLIAHAWLNPVEDQPARGYGLEYTYNHKQLNRRLSEQQIDRCTTLVSKLRNYLEDKLQRAGWREIARPQPGRSIWQHESRITPAPAVQGRKGKPVIHIDDLAPKETPGGYLATWHEGALIAYARLLPIGDQPAQGYTLECGHNTSTGWAQGNAPIHQDSPLVDNVRELMQGQLLRAGWRITGRQEDKDIWQHSSRLASSVREQDQARSKRSVDGLAAARRKLEETIAAHKAEQTQDQAAPLLQEATFTLDDFTAAPFSPGMSGRRWYHAQAVAGDVQATIDLIPARAFPDRYRVQEVSGRVNIYAPGAIGKKQAARAQALRDALLERVRAALVAANWTEQGNMWKQPDQAGATSQQKTLLVPARARVKSYSRTITASEVTFTCSRCGNQVTKLLYPGAAPRYCDDCAQEVTREKTRARVARLRAGKRGGQAQTS